MHMHNVWTTPLEAIAIIALALAITQGLYALPTLWILIVVIPLQCELLGMVPACCVCLLRVRFTLVLQHMCGLEHDGLPGQESSTYTMHT